MQSIFFLKDWFILLLGVCVVTSVRSKDRKKQDAESFLQNKIQENENIDIHLSIEDVTALPPCSTLI